MFSEILSGNLTTIRAHRCTGAGVSPSTALKAAVACRVKSPFIIQPWRAKNRLRGELLKELFLNSKDQLFSEFQIPESHESKEGSRESQERGQEAVKK